MTLSQLAKLAHVSTSTASKAFSMSDEVNEKTRNMIFDIAKAHGCFKQFYRSEYPGLVIALICPEFDSTYYSSFISEIQKCVSQHNSELFVASTNFSVTTEHTLIEYYEKYHTVDGIILLNGISDTPQKNEIPIAKINCFDNTPSAILVNKDIFSPIKEAIGYWIDKGITDIGFIGDPYTMSREKMVRQILSDKIGAINEKFFSKSDKRFEEGGYHAMKSLIDEGNLPRALVCAYDRFAVGAMKALSDAGISVPGDVAVLGIDDAPQSAYLSPALSSINHEIERTCALVSDALFKKIHGKEYDGEITVVCKFIQRESSRIE